MNHNHHRPPILKTICGYLSYLIGIARTAHENQVFQRVGIAVVGRVFGVHAEIAVHTRRFHLREEDVHTRRGVLGHLHRDRLILEGEEQLEIGVEWGRGRSIGGRAIDGVGGSHGRGILGTSFLLR